MDVAAHGILTTELEVGRAANGEQHAPSQRGFLRTYHCSWMLRLHCILSLGLFKFKIYGLVLSVSTTCPAAKGPFHRIRFEMPGC